MVCFNNFWDQNTYNSIKTNQKGCLGGPHRLVLGGYLRSIPIKTLNVTEIQSAVHTKILGI